MVYTHEQLLRMLADVIISRFPISDLELLLQAGTDPNGAVVHGLRPLHYAAFAGGDQLYIDKLVEHGAEVNCVDNVGYTPLHVAAKAGSRDAIRNLIRHGADVNGLILAANHNAENNITRDISNTPEVNSNEAATNDDQGRETEDVFDNVTDTARIQSSQREDVVDEPINGAHTRPEYTENVTNDVTNGAHTDQEHTENGSNDVINVAQTSQGRTEDSQENQRDENIFENSASIGCVISSASCENVELHAPEQSVHPTNECEEECKLDTPNNNLTEQSQGAEGGLNTFKYLPPTRQICSEQNGVLSHVATWDTILLDDESQLFSASSHVVDTFTGDSIEQNVSNVDKVPENISTLSEIASSSQLLIEVFRSEAEAELHGGAADPVMVVLERSQPDVETGPLIAVHNNADPALLSDVIGPPIVIPNDADPAPLDDVIGPLIVVRNDSEVTLPAGVADPLLVVEGEAVVPALPGDENDDAAGAQMMMALIEPQPTPPGDATGHLVEIAAHIEAEPTGSLSDSPLSIAVEYGHVECVEELLMNHADPNIPSFLGCIINTMPLEHTKCLKLLLRYGADPDSPSRGGMTALMRAAKQQQVEAVLILLEHGANVNVQCPPRFDRRRAIHFAVIVGSLEIVNLLLDAGAYTSKPPGYSCAPLEYAITHNKADICLALLQHGADPDELNEDGCTPLQVLCATSSLTHLKDMIGYLLCAGAQPNLHSDQFSYTGPSLCPLIEYLTYNDQLDFTIVKLMLQYGARVNFTVPTRLLKIQDASGVLGQLRKLRPHEDLLELIMDAAEKFDAEAIKRDHSLSNGKHAALLEAATNARSLKRLARIMIISTIRKTKHSTPEEWFNQLPLPSYLIRYIMFETV